MSCLDPWDSNTSSWSFPSLRFFVFQPFFGSLFALDKGQKPNRIEEMNRHCASSFVSNRSPADSALAAGTHVTSGGDAPVFCVMGAGHGGLAMAGWLALKGCRVQLYNRTDEKLNGVRWHGGIRLSGAVQGFGAIERATSDIAEAMEGAKVILVVTPATAHRPLAGAMAPHLRDGQIVLLNPGRTFGAIEVRQVLMERGIKADVCVGETQTFLFASRAVSRNGAHIYRVKNKVPLATLPAHRIPMVLDLLQPVLPAFSAGNNVLCTSLDNIGAIFHPALTLLNAGWIEATQGDFDYYLQGITPSTARVLEALDGERVLLARALGVGTVTAREWLYLTYDSSGRNLYEAIQRTDAYRGIRAPPNIQHRYVFEDVPMSLVPMASLGKQVGVTTPVIELVIQLASRMHECDYWKVGRTMERLGLAGKSIREIRRLAIGGAEGE